MLALNEALEDHAPRATDRGSRGSEPRCAMKPLFSQTILDDLSEAVQLALSTRGIVNIPRLAEEIRKRNEAENIALEDITEMVMVQAQKFSAAMEFDSPRLN